jgi:hypothetical protein
MVRRLVPALVGAVVVAGLTWSTTAAEPLPPAADPTDRLSSYSGVVDADGLAAIVALGVDRHELHASPVAGSDGLIAVETILSGQQAAALVADGATLAPATTGAGRRSAAATEVFRPYSGAGGIQEELAAQAAGHRRIAELVVIGETVQGQDITAVRVTAEPSRIRAGKRPTTVYIGAQHAREWITPEMVRRLLATVLDGYGNDREITRLVNDNELWFIPVANPDGYDFTFQDGQRLWRKNMRDNDGDGTITTGDGVDLNRNYPTRWGYDNEGSSPNPASETYRGPAPASEPETQALDRLVKRITPEFLVNYHSAAELLLHGIGWQVATPSADDVLYEAMVGDDATPAIPGYDPDISAELYTTNGDTDSHMQERYATLGFTPEMGTCESASAVDPDDPYEPEDCGSGFEFPDDETLVAAEFRKNVPFALAVARSAADPDDPVSVVGIDSPNFVVDSFDVSYGDPQEVAVTAKQALRQLTMEYRVNGGRTRRVGTHEWSGGERYGFENDDYYGEFRGTVRGARAGDRVEVWFSAADPAGRGSQRLVTSDHFTYTVASDTGRKVLVLADEDTNGVNPEAAPTGAAPKYVDEHVAALAANGVRADVWDVSTQGVPHDLGVLGHYDAVVWYLGDNRLTQDPEDEITETPIFAPPFDLLPDSSVAERAQYLTIAVRDYLNEGGKLIHAGETTAYAGVLNDLLGGALGGIYYGLNGAPDQPCIVDTDPGSDCLLLADDFAQYYLGAYSRGVRPGTGIVGTAGPAAGDEAAFGGPATVGNPVDEPGNFRVTSDILPPDVYPEFASAAFLEYTGVEGGLEAIEGEFAVAAEHLDDSYMRLGRTYDLTSTAAAQAPTFEAQLGWSAESSYDHVIVEARVVGTDAWTTLPERGGATTDAVPADCEQGFYIGEHPQLEHYLTFSLDGCTATGTTGSWHALTGESGGWVPVAFDLSAFAGQQVEVVVSYVTDPSTGGNGVIIDDTKLTTTAGVADAEGFETGLGAWTVLGPPAGSPGSAVDWERAPRLGKAVAGVATEDSVLLGFGIEQLADPAAQAELVGDALRLLGIRTRR